MKDFNIQYLTGDHAYVLQYIGSLAVSSESSFDWYDCAAVSQVLRENIDIFDQESRDADRGMDRIVNRLEHIL